MKFNADNKRLIGLINSVKATNDFEETELSYINKLKDVKDFKCTSLDEIDEAKILIIPTQDKLVKVYIE